MFSRAEPLGHCSRELWVSHPRMGSTDPAMCTPREPGDRGRMHEERSKARTVSRLLDRIRDARFSHGVRCPRCNAEHVQRWGRFSGRQRYRCQGCSRTFSDLTGTAAAYAKKLAEWERYRWALADSLSVRRAAALLEIHPSTAFRWRHALLRALRSRERTVLGGWVELGEVGFAYSEKGKRAGRQAAERSSWAALSPDRARRLARERAAERRRQRHRADVKVVVACDRLGGAVSRLVPERKVRWWDLEEVLNPHLADDVVLVARGGWLSDYARYARRRRCVYEDARRPRLRPVTTLAHVRTVSGYVRRLVGWLPRFRGVATKYLPHYLVWHELLDRWAQQHPAVEVLRWPVSAGAG